MAAATQQVDQPVAGFSATSEPILDYARELGAVLESIVEPLGLVERTISECLTSRSAAIQRLLTYVSELSGKRLRPALALLSAKSLGVWNSDTIRCGAAVELVHAATLVHDDILDHASLRRHRPTLHCQSNVHDSVLTGDWLFTQAYALLNEGDSTIPGRWLARAAKEICEGEIRQNLAVGQSRLTIEEYLSIVGQKTGSLCAVSCKLGAWTAGANENDCQAYYDFGWRLGTAFQIHDDFLDYWGEDQRLGKRVGSDFFEGKWTLPLIRLAELVTPEDGQRLLACLESPSHPGFAQVREWFDQYRVAEFCRSMASRLSYEAIASLPSSPMNTSRRHLERLAMAAIERKA